MTLQTSASAQDLLALDDDEDWADPSLHPVWRAVVEGDAPRQTAVDLVLALYPLFTGRARYLLAAKVSWLDLDDGKEIFADLHRSLTDPDADADAGWSATATALGIDEDELDGVRDHPPAAAGDLVSVVREHSHRSAHEGVGVAWVLDRRLPSLLGQLADALVAHYGVPEGAVAHLRHRASEDAAVRSVVERLARRYLVDPWDVYTARRAGREVLWDLTALFEEVAQP